jgi:hypothetical protein
MRLPIFTGVALPFAAVVCALGLTFLASGCVVHRQIQMIPRDSGKVYSGTLEGRLGAGKMTVTIDGRQFTGPVVTTQSNESFGYFQTFGRNGSTAGFIQAGGGGILKAVLTSSDEHGLRCDLVGDGSGHGSAICVDDNKRVYDGIVSK